MLIKTYPNLDFERILSEQLTSVKQYILNFNIVFSVLPLSRIAQFGNILLLKGGANNNDNNQ